ncbi:hypothetical protein [Microbacterium sp. P03]|uniref:DUF7933 domain-containing protein n=1 Tax=Microbacterium sp. P03 TaxID=3366946 RepID=UPI0037476F23
MDSLRRARRHVRGGGFAVSTALVAALIGGLLGSPSGQAAAAVPSPTPTTTSAVETPAPTPSETEEPSEGVDPTETATPEPSDSSSPALPTDDPDTADAGVPVPTTAPVPGETPAGEASSPTTDAPAPDPHSWEEQPRAGPFSARAEFGILAAGVPDAPTQLAIETFEQNQANVPTGIATYPTSGAARYTAAAFWQSTSNCTGVLTNYDAVFPGNTYCSTLLGLGTLPQRQTRRMADVLGQVSAGVVGGATTAVNQSSATTRANHALAATTAATISSSANQIVIESAAPTGIAPTASRYYTLGLDMVGDECGSTQAQLDMFLLIGTTPRQLTASALNACALTGNLYTSPTISTTNPVDVAWGASVKAARLTADTAVLLTAAEATAARVRVTNRTGAVNGNVFAIDNVRLLDATPALDVAFAPASVPAGTVSTLTYTVTNTSEAAAKPDWSFSNSLPAGLVVAPTPAVGGTCANSTGTAFTVAAAAGGSTVSAVGGDLVAGTTSCTVTVNVLSTSVGSYTVGQADLTTPLLDDTTATLAVTAATTITVRKNIVSRASSTDQFTLSLRNGTTVLASATTTGTATGLQAAQVNRYIVQPNTTYTIHEAPVSGAGLAYGSSYECVRGGTVVAAGANPAGTITTPADQGAEIVCTFTNTTQTVRLACDTNHFYSVSPAGALVQGDIVSGTTTTVGSWSAATSSNALGIGAGGTIAYSIDRSSDGTDVTSVLKWSAGGGFQTLPSSSFATVAGGTEITGSIVAGAVDLSGQRYVFGKFANSQFYLWSFTESNPTATRFAFLGSFPTGSAPNGNGDIAFDARGNLYVLGATSDTSNSAAIFTVTAAALAAGTGGTLAVGASTSKVLAGTDTSPTFGSVNGIAFTPRGTAYLSSTTSAYEFDPTTWTRVPNTPRVAIDSTDLAGCTSPSTLTVQKNIVGRAATADQFQLTASNGAVTIATATTTGSAVGRQPAQIGPVPVVTGTSVTISEAMATGSTSVIGIYTTIYECWADGVRLATGTTTTGSVTIPARLSAQVVCTYFNSPRAASSVTVTKLVQDPVSGVTQPSAGWTLGVSAAATAGAATVLPSEAPQQQSDAAGTAVWSVLFSAVTARATLTISEVQRTGFTFVSGSCTVNGVATPVSFSTSSSGIVSGTIAGVQSASTVACTMTNRPTASLTLVKIVSSGSALPTDWVLSAVGPTGALPGPSGRSGSAQATAVPVTPGLPYRLGESAGSLVYVQTGAWQCVTGTGQQVAVSSAGDVVAPSSSTVTCTVTNATASITLLKQVQSPQTGFQPANFRVTATPAAISGGVVPTESRLGADYSATGNPSSTFEVRPGHSYTLTEAAADPARPLAYRQLRLERLVGSTWTPVSSATVTAPAAGQAAIYRFVNAPVLPPQLPLTGGTGTDVYLYTGSAVLVLALALAVWHGRRRTRRSAF